MAAVSGLGQPGYGRCSCWEDFGVSCVLGIVEWALKKEVVSIWWGAQWGQHVEVRAAAARAAVGAGGREGCGRHKWGRTNSRAGSRKWGGAAIRGYWGRAGSRRHPPLHPTGPRTFRNQPLMRINTKRLESQLQASGCAGASTVGKVTCEWPGR